MDGISRSRGWDKEIPHGVLPMEQLVFQFGHTSKTDRYAIQIKQGHYQIKFKHVRGTSQK